MSEQEIQDIWMNAGDEDTIEFDLPQLVTNLKGKMNKINRTLFFRDGREILAAVVVMCIFSYKIVADVGIINKVTSAMFVVWAGYVIYKLMDVRKVKMSADMGQSFKHQMLQHKHYLQQQAHLLNSVISWYVGPFAIIYIIRILGRPYDDPFWVMIGSMGLSLTFIILFSWGIYALNKYAAKTGFNPLIENIDRVLLQLEEEAIT